MCAIHELVLCGQSMDCTAQTTDGVVCSHVQSKDKLRISGVALG